MTDAAIISPDASLQEAPAARDNLQEVEEVANELKRLLISHERTLTDEGVRQQVEQLERWMESYRRGVAAARKISETGLGWLTGLRDHLRLSADERLRLEGEGGNPASKEQAAKTDELLKALHRIEKMMPGIEQMFKCQHNEAAPEDSQSHPSTPRAATAN